VDFTIAGRRHHQALTRAQIKASDVDLWEINEAFAVVRWPHKLLGLSPDKVNVPERGVARHPIGASGARPAGPLLYAMKD